MSGLDDPRLLLIGVAQGLVGAAALALAITAVATRARRSGPATMLVVAAAALHGLILPVAVPLGYLALRRYLAIFGADAMVLPFFVNTGPAVLVGAAGLALADLLLALAFVSRPG